MCMLWVIIALVYNYFCIPGILAANGDVLLGQLSDYSSRVLSMWLLLDLEMYFPLGSSVHLSLVLIRT